MVACDKCDHWFHLHCTGLTQAPKPKEPWLCIQCFEDESAMAEMRKQLLQINYEAEEHARVERETKAHFNSLEEELKKCKEELEEKEKEEDSKQDVLQSLAKVIRRSKFRSQSEESING